MTKEEALQAWKKMRSEIDETNWLFVGIINPQMVDMAIEALQAEAVPQSEQYKKCFEDAKRAFELEYARESENIRKRNAQLEVMLNAQKAISAYAEQHWIPCSERLPDTEVLCCDKYRAMIIAYVYEDDTSDTGFSAESETQYMNNCIAWMPLPKPYREDGGKE